MNLMKILAIPALALCLAGPSYIAPIAPPASTLCTAMGEDCPEPGSYRIFEVGPGLNNLAAEDDYASYQWGLKNDGHIRRIETVLNIDSLDQLYLHQNDKGTVDGVTLPRLEPCNFDQITTDAVQGMDINIQPAWDIYSRVEVKRPVVVAIIDTGIDITHPDLEHAIWTNENEIPGDGIDNDGNGYIDDIHGWNFYDGNNTLYSGEADTHGTHGAGTIAAAKGNGGVVGITDNKDVKIMVLKALGSDEGRGSIQEVLEAIRYAEANGASICNLSFGSDYSDASIAAAIRDSKMLFVVAAGNGDSNGIGYNIDTSPVYPASLPYDNVISVADMMFDGKLDESSNFGPRSVDIAAPGVYILSTSSNHGFAYMTGTSMSAPMVTGVAAMVYASHPELDLAGVRNAILSTARKTKDLKGRISTGGMLDAAAAMAYGLPESVVNPAPQP